MTDHELLLAIADLMDKKLKSELQAQMQPIKDEIASMKNQLEVLKSEQKKTNLVIENEICPNINLLKENYVPASRRYLKESSRIESMQADIDVMKSVLREHSEKLQKIS